MLKQIVFWLIWPPFSGWLQKFHNTDIVSLASTRGILEPPSAVFSVCQNLYQKLVLCWHVFWQMHKLQIHKLVSRCDHLNISIMYSVFDWKEFEILSYRWAFREYRNQCFWRIKCFGKGTSTLYAVAEIKRPILDSTKISASEEPNALEKVPVQFMPFWKLSRKCHFSFGFARVTEVRHMKSRLRTPLLKRNIIS